MNHAKKDHLHKLSLENNRHHHRPYWQRAHHDWKFWVVLLLALLAMVIYVESNDLSLAPRGEIPHRIP